MATLFEEHKAERRERILAAARRLIARHGFAGLTMRDLAQEARVSVPTVYNLIGGKHELLSQLLEAVFVDIGAGVARIPEASGPERVLAVIGAAQEALTAAPRYARGLVNVFLASDEGSELRRRADQGYVTLLAMELSRCKAEGSVAAFVDPLTLAASLYGTHMSTTIAWAKGDLDDDGWRDASTFGCSLALLAVAQGEARERLQTRIETTQARCRERLLAYAPGKQRGHRKGATR